MSTSIRTQDGFRPFRSNVFSSPGNLAERAANADGLIDGASGASAKAAQHHAARADGVVHGTPPGTARALRHPDFISQIAIPANVDAIEPRRVEELAGLHMESDGDRILLANSIGRRPAAVATAEVEGHALARYPNRTPVPVSIAITILVGVLRRGKRGERDQKQNRDNQDWSELCSRLSHNASQESDSVIPLTAR
jgi:hypothetical protein